jgi:hypothetical protein
MEEQEINTESLQEIVHEKAHHISWAEKVALTTALLAVLAAFSSLMSTHESDRSILFKIEASDQWSFYQAKGIKSIVALSPEERARYKQEQEQIREKAEEASRESNHALHIHEFFAFAVTIFQVATAVGAIAVLVKRKYLWHVSLTLGAVGLLLIARALLLFTTV